VGGDVNLEAVWWTSANVKAVETALTDAIEQWLRVPTAAAEYEHGNAQGIARALAALRSTTFTAEWSAGLDRYQDRVVLGETP
jgi:predicted secreted Zn-dependent protease